MGGENNRAYLDEFDKGNPVFSSSVAVELDTVWSRVRITR